MGYGFGNLRFVSVNKKFVSGNYKNILITWCVFFGSMSITQLYIGSTHINDKKNN